MDLFTTQRIRSESPPQKNSFQRELEAKMRDRRKKGLSADLSEDELGSDNELLDHFNLTSQSSASKQWKSPGSRGSPALSDRSSPANRKSPFDANFRQSPYSERSSPYSGRQTPGIDEMDGDVGLGGLSMMKTIKNPSQMASTIGTATGKKVAPSPQRRKSKALEALDEIQGAKSGVSQYEKPGKENKPWQPPTFSKTNDITKRMGSPLNVDSDDERLSNYSRKSPGLFDSLDAKPSPRYEKSGEREKTRLRPRSPWAEDEEDLSEVKPKPRARTKGLFGDENYQREATKNQSKTRSSSKSPIPKPKSRSITKSPTGKKTPTEEPTPKTKPGSLFEMMSQGETTKNKKPKKKSSLLLDSDSDDDVSAYGAADKMSKFGRKSPFEKEEKRVGFDVRKSPGPVEQRSVSYGNKRPHLRKTATVHDESGEDYLDGNSAFETVNHEENDERVSRLRHKKSPSGERESSLCRDVDKDPSPMKHSTTKEAEEIKKKEIRSHTGANKLLETAIETIENAQAMDDTSKKEEASTKKMTKHKPKPRYAKPQLDLESSRPTDFNSTTNICSAVYQDWYKQKEERIKQQLKEKKEKEKEEQEKKKKAEEEKLVEAKASYQGWMEKKKEILSQKAREKRKEEEKKSKEIGEKFEKKRDAETTFKMWKENKDVIIKETERKKKRAEEDKRRQEQEKKLEREKHSKSAFSGWNKKKEVVLTSTLTARQQEERKKEQEKLREQHRREREALESYQRWLDKKEKQEYQQRNLSSSTLERPAWSPAGRTIPVGR